MTLSFSGKTKKILNILIKSEGEWVGRKIIEERSKASKSAANYALDRLAREGVVKREEKGRSYYYRLNSSSPVIKQYKVLLTTEKIYPLIRRLKPSAKKIILFGSSSRGENMPDSDIDLLVLAREKEEVKKIVRAGKASGKIQLILKNPVEFSELEKKDPYFFKEIDRGIVLWEKYER